MGTRALPPSTRHPASTAGRSLATAQALTLTSMYTAVLVSTCVTVTSLKPPSGAAWSAASMSCIRRKPPCRAHAHHTGAPSSAHPRRADNHPCAPSCDEACKTPRAWGAAHRERGPVAGLGRPQVRHLSSVRLDALAKPAPPPSPHRLHHHQDQARCLMLLAAAAPTKRPRHCHCPCPPPPPPPPPPPHTGEHLSPPAPAGRRRHRHPSAHAPVPEAFPTTFCTTPRCRPPHARCAHAPVPKVASVNHQHMLPRLHLRQQHQRKAAYHMAPRAALSLLPGPAPQLLRPRQRHNSLCPCVARAP